ncbi:MAG: TetR/AcrR family transcriptional regulator [Pseudobdellovibrio sp.]
MAKKSLKNSIRSPSQSRSKSTVDAILEATAHILKKDGSDDCSTNKIAERAGVSIGSVYQYFKDKESILLELSLQERQKDMLALKGVLDATKGRALDEVIRSLLTVGLERLSDEPMLRRILNQEISIKKQKGFLHIRHQLVQFMMNQLKTYGKFTTPEDEVQKRLVVIVSGIEAAFFTAIEEFGKDLEPEEFVNSITLVVYAFLQSCIEN